MNKTMTPLVKCSLLALIISIFLAGLVCLAGCLRRYLKRRKILTKYEHIHSMDIEQLASFLANAGSCMTCYYYNHKIECAGNRVCPSGIYKWLQSEMTDDDEYGLFVQEDVGFSSKENN